MSESEKPSTALRPLVLTWLALVLLTFISLGAGQWLHGVSWLPLLVAGIIWLKGWLVARHFIEAKLTHPFIARVLAGFIAFVPLMLILLAFYGDEFARWASL